MTKNYSADLKSSPEWELSANMIRLFHQAETDENIKFLLQRYCEAYLSVEDFSTDITLFREFWQMLCKYYNVEDSEEYWATAVMEMGKWTREHKEDNYILARKLATALLAYNQIRMLERKGIK